VEFWRFLPVNLVKVPEMHIAIGRKW
jgi:hypothetical protein